ncbi:hypothetical protein [Pseudomonas farris]
MCLFSAATLIVGIIYWQPSGHYIYILIPGSPLFHFAALSMVTLLGLTIYCFRYGSTFWQWLGIRQLIARVRNEKIPEPYRLRQEGIKRYIRFPHHTFLMLFFWAHPIMTYDTLLFSIGTTIYMYLGTYHMDSRMEEIFGDQWRIYKKDTGLMLPSLRALARLYADLRQRPNVIE